jgi:hypothetical protein
MARTVPLKYVKSLLKLSSTSTQEQHRELEALGIDATILEDPPPPQTTLSTDEYGRLFMHLIKRLQTELETQQGDLNSLLEFSTYRMMYLGPVGDF